MLKHLPLIPIFELTNIITNIIKLGYFPLKWKTAAVIPILKPGKDPTKSSDRASLSSRQSSRENDTNKNVPSCGLN
ncbi:hypothetical protein TNCV_1398741 [Trichonephila clavipes]|nr:hypothetical protein TNCV_1398741 [Trichonephila clavipes]